MRINKKILIIISSVLGAFIIIYAADKIFFSIFFPEKELKSYAQDFVKKTLNKAILFEDIYVDFFGDIVMLKPNISLSNDFNDNTSLISARKAVVKLKFLDLITGKMKVRRIVFNDPEVNIYNKYAGPDVQKFDYKKIISDNFRDIAPASLNNISFRFRNANINYIDIFKDKRHTIAFYDSDAEVSFERNSVLFSLSGNIKPFKTKGIKRGAISTSGEFSFQKKAFQGFSMSLEYFDMSYFNEYLEYGGIRDYQAFGGLNCNLRVVVRDSSVSWGGDAELTNFNLISAINEQNKIVANENLNISFKAVDDKNKSKFTINEIKFYDDNAKIQAGAEYDYTPKKEGLSVSVKSDKINLTNLSGNFTPAKNINYGGQANVNLTFIYDVAKSQLKDLNLNYLLKGFFVTKFDRGGLKKLVSGCDISISANKQKADLKAEGYIKDSKASVSMNTMIKNLDPLQSDSDINISIEKMYGSQIIYFLKNSMEAIFDKAYEDVKRGYEDIFFTQKPAGKYINSNNLNLTFASDRIQVFDNDPSKFLTGLKLKLALSSGFLRTSEFSLTGFGGNFQFDAGATFNAEQPFIKIKAGATGIDMDVFSRVSSSISTVSGKLSYLFDYEVSAYRFSNILENSKGDLSVTIADCAMNNTDIQKTLTQFFNNTGYTAVDFNGLSFRNFNISVGHIADNFYIKSFSLLGPALNFAGYGKYNYSEGLNMPVIVNITDKNNKIVSAPVVLKGRLFNPDIEIRNLKTVKTFRLFDID